MCYTCNKVLPCIDLSEAGHIEEDVREDDEGIGGDVDDLQLGAVGHLLGQARDTVVRQVKF